jgi:hypothetical protein
MVRQITYEKLINFINENEKGKYEVLRLPTKEEIEQDKILNDKVFIKHLSCGNIYPVKPDKFFNGRRCPNCQHGSKAKTQEQFEKEIYDLYGDEVKVVDIYTKNNKKMKFIHYPKNSFLEPHEFETTPLILLDSRKKEKNGCPCGVCSKNHMANSLKDKFYKAANGEYELLSEITTYNQPITIKHLVCGNVYTLKQAGTFIIKGRRCNKCKNLKPMITTDEFKKEVFDLVGDEYTVLGDYQGDKVKIKMRHNKCNKEFFMKPNAFKCPNSPLKDTGNRCPYCSGIFSKFEDDLVKYIKTFYSSKIIRNSRKIISPKELDIYFPDKKIAIECNGNIYHSTAYNSDKNYHLNKTVECEKKGIQLIHIFEDEWYCNQNIIKAKIKHILGCDNNEPIYARKCYVEEISSSDKNTFLNENHIQGADKANIKLGLWYSTEDGDRLVSVMTFCKSRFDKRYDYELSRFATDIEYRVIGSFGKLFTYFKEHYLFNNIITYADRRYSSNILSNTIYEKNGFVLNKISDPSYDYIDTNDNIKVRYSRLQFQKAMLQEKFPDIYDINKSEREIMEEAGYARIYNCGNYVYTYTNNN